MTDGNSPIGGDDEFDRIVEGLDLDFSLADQDAIIPDPNPDPYPAAARPAPVEEDADEVAYRTPAPRAPRPPNPARTTAWAIILGGPTLLVFATVGGIILSRPIVFSVSIIFVAAVIYLISRLPEHGPSHPDWPDDGAVL